MSVLKSALLGAVLGCVLAGGYYVLAHQPEQPTAPALVGPWLGCRDVRVVSGGLQAQLCVYGDVTLLCLARENWRTQTLSCTLLPGSQKGYLAP